MIDHQIVPEQRLVVLKFEGKITGTDLAEYFDTLIKAEHYQPSFRGVADLRLARPEMAPDEVEQLGQLAAQKQVSCGNWAYIADNPMATALAILYQENVAPAHPSEIFSTIQGASEYLGVDLEPYLEG